MKIAHSADAHAERISELLDVSVERVSRIEREGNLTVHTIVLVANALGVPAASLRAEPAPAAPRGTRQGRPRKTRT